MKQRLPPDDPCEWLNRARSSLSLAYAQSDETYYEDLCYQAEQAAEKAIKAIFIALKRHFPYTHDIHLLVTLLEDDGVEIPDEIFQAGRLTVYAVQTRYPGFSIPIDENHYRQALSLAESVIVWSERVITSLVYQDHEDESCSDHR